MKLMSTTERFGAIAIAIHWVSAALFVVLIASGFRAAAAIDPAAKAAFLRVHVLLGAVMLGLTLGRIAWWCFDRKPDPVAGMRRSRQRLAKIVHVLFYVLILGMTATGIGTLALSGAGPFLLGSAAGAPDFWQYQPRLEHWIGARLLLGLVALHVGAALYHQLVRRDGVVSRMLPARS
jgi:cytochrome b561